MNGSSASQPMKTSEVRSDGPISLTIYSTTGTLPWEDSDLLQVTPHSLILDSRGSGESIVWLGRAVSSTSNQGQSTIPLSVKLI